MGCLRPAGSRSRPDSRGERSWSVASTIWKCEVERRAAARRRVDPEASAVALDDLLADRQADPGARVLVATVQPLKQVEHTLAVFGSDADAIIADGAQPAA